MFSDKYEDDYEDDYLTKLQAEMADPTDAQVATCRLCGRRLAYRSWPASGPRALKAFIDGLAALEARIHVPVYGFWVDNPELDRPEDPTVPAELWRAADFTLLGTGPSEEMAARMNEHRCPPRN